MNSARHVNSTAGVVVYRSLDRPALGLTDDDVFPCECVDRVPDDQCPDCRGTGLLHGYDDNGRGLPVVVGAYKEPALPLPQAVRAAS